MSSSSVQTVKRSPSWLLWLCLLACLQLSCVSARRTPVSNYPIDGPNLELLRLGDTLFESDQLEEAAQMYARAVNANGPNHAHVEACAQLGHITFQLGDLREAKIWLDLGARRATEEDPLGWSRLQHVTGILERHRGRTEDAVKRFKDLFTYCMNTSLYRRALAAAQEVVVTSEDPQVQIVWANKGIDAAEAGGLFAWLGQTWSRKGVALHKAGRLAEASVAFQAAKDYFSEAGETNQEFLAAWELARVLRERGDLTGAWNLAGSNLSAAQAMYEMEPSALHARWMGYCLWEVAELKALDGEQATALAGMRTVRAKFKEAGFENGGAFACAELERLDGRMAVIGAGSE